MVQNERLREAREIAARAWCEPLTERIPMDPALAEEFANILAGWIETAAQFARNSDFYRDLLIQVARCLGPEVFISDDGSVQDEPLLLKIPELIERLVKAE